MSPTSTRKPSCRRRRRRGRRRRGSRRRACRGERLDRDDGRSLVRRRQQQRVEEGVVRRDVALVAERRGVERAMPSSCARCSTRSRSGPSPTRQSRASTPRSAQPREGGEHVGHALDRRHAADPADDERVRRGCRSRRRSSAPSAPPRAIRRSRSMPSRMTENFSAGATPSSTRSSRTSGLTATSRVVARASERSSLAEDRVRSRVEVPAQHVAVEGVDDDRRPCARPRAALPMRPTAPAFAVCVCRMCGRTSPDQAGDRGSPRAGRERRDLAVHARKLDDLDAELAPRRTTSSLRPAPASRRRASSRSRDSASPCVRYATWSAGPPMFSRAISAEDADLAVGHGVSRAARRPCGAGPPRARPTARSRAPRGRRRGRPTSRGCRPGAAARTPSRPACRGSPRSCPRRG